MSPACLLPRTNKRCSGKTSTDSPEVTKITRGYLYGQGGVCAAPPAARAPRPRWKAVLWGERHARVPSVGPAARADGARLLLPHPPLVPAAVRHLLPEQGPVCGLRERHGWSSAAPYLLGEVRLGGEGGWLYAPGGRGVGGGRGSGEHPA